MNSRKHIGIMGGTFNPVHMVHLILAENAWRVWQLDEVIMLPSGDPPHKAGQTIASAADRLAMLKLAVRDVSYFHVSDMEVRRKGYSYTSVTLEELRKNNPDADYYFIMGADSVFQIETWHEPANVMRNCIILAATRNQTPTDEFQRQIDYLKNKYGADIRLLNIPDLALSSSEIRSRVREGLPIRFMVPDAVMEYIESHGLYSDPDSEDVNLTFINRTHPHH